MVSVIHRAQLVVLQQFGQLARIHAIILIAFFQQSISPRIANYQFADVALQQVVQPGGPGSFLEGDVHLSTQPINKLQDHAGFGLDDTFDHDLAGRIPDRDRDAFLMYVHTDILTAAGHNRVCSFQDGLWDNQTLHEKGPPFYNAFHDLNPVSQVLFLRGQIKAEKDCAFDQYNTRVSEATTSQSRGTPTRRL